MTTKLNSKHFCHALNIPPWVIGLEPLPTRTRRITWVIEHTAWLTKMKLRHIR